MHDYISWLLAVEAHHKRVTPKVHRLIDWMKATYMRLDTERKWVVPFSIIAFVVFTIAFFPVALVVGGYGWLLLAVVKYDKVSYFLYRAGYRAWRWARAFVGCAIMCLIVHVLFIAVGLETMLATFMGK